MDIRFVRVVVLKMVHNKRLMALTCVRSDTQFVVQFAFLCATFSQIPQQIVRRIGER